MSGHNKWTQIKHQKGVTDQKRGQLFSKLLNAVSVAAKIDPNPNTNTRLKGAVQKAKDANIPLENIDRAIKRIKNSDGTLEELILEAYGPGGAAILIEAISDNRNRTVAEIKKVLSVNGGRWGEPGSVRWVFEKGSENTGANWVSKFTHTTDSRSLEELKKLIEVLREHPDVQGVFCNAL